MPWSTYLHNAVQAHVSKGTAFAQPAGIYIGLSSAEPLADGSGVSEPADAAYARQACNGWSAPAGGVISNAAQVDFPEATAEQGTQRYWFASDSATKGAGNLLWYGALTAAQTISVGGQLSFPVGALSTTLAAGD
jgi:hypothetical protein